MSVVFVLYIIYDEQKKNETLLNIGTLVVVFPMTKLVKYKKFDMITWLENL